MKYFYLFLFLFSGMFFGQINNIDYHPGENVEISKLRIETTLIELKNDNDFTIKANYVDLSNIDITLQNNTGEHQIRVNTKFTFFTDHLTIAFSDYEYKYEGKFYKSKDISNMESLIPEINKRFYEIFKTEFYKNF